MKRIPETIPFRRGLYILMAAVLLQAVTAGCAKEGLQPGAISIRFQFEELGIDLNIVDNPYITCVVNSETGLERVSMFIEYEDGSEVMYKEPITDFYNPKLCSIYERPVYEASMTGFRVEAEDIGGGRAEGAVLLDVTPAVDAPEIVFAQESIAFSEGDPFPDFSFEVTSDSDLAQVTVELVESGSLTALVTPVDAFDDPRHFVFRSADYTLADYDIKRIPSAVRVSAQDSYGKLSIETLPIDYKALPAPEVTVAELSPVDEYVSCTVSGRATSETGIAEVSYYTVGEDYECFIASYPADGSADYAFSAGIPGEEILDYLTGIKVVVKDRRDKETEVTVPLTVNPVYTMLQSGEDLHQTITALMGNDKYRNVKIELPASAEFTLPEQVPVTKNLMLRGDDSGAQPTVNVASSYAFTTDNADIDAIRFENIRFVSGTGNSFFMGNTTSPCTVGTIECLGCTLEGFTNAFYRTGAASTISSIVIDGSLIFWGNSNGSYSFLHFTQNTGALEDVTITNSTFTGVMYLHYNNLRNTECNMRIASCTFANTRGSSNGYFISYGGGSVSGTVTLEKLLFGGTCNITGGYRMLRSNAVERNCSDNWCTPDWKTFTDDTTNGSVNFLSILPESEDSGSLFADPQNNDFTIVVKYGTVFSRGIGDPRWLE